MVMRKDTDSLTLEGEDDCSCCHHQPPLCGSTKSTTSSHHRLRPLDGMDRNEQIRRIITLKVVKQMQFQTNISQVKEAIDAILSSQRDKSSISKEKEDHGYIQKETVP